MNRDGSLNRDGNLNRNQSGSRLKVESKRMAGLRRNWWLMLNWHWRLDRDGRFNWDGRLNRDGRLNQDWRLTTTHKKDETPKMCAKKNTTSTQTTTTTLLKVCMPYTKFYAILYNMSSQKINQHIINTEHHPSEVRNSTRDSYWKLLQKADGWRSNFLQVSTCEMYSGQKNTCTLIGYRQVRIEFACFLYKA